MAYDILVDCLGITAFAAGAGAGKYVSGRTENGMSVSLKVHELPFDLASCQQERGKYYPIGGKMYAISDEQYDAMMRALAQKIDASESLSRTNPPVALIAR